MRELQRTIIREVGTCAGAFDFTVVDVGSSPTTSTAARKLAMLAIVVRCPDVKGDSCKVRTPIYTVILMYELVRVYAQCIAINCVRESCVSQTYITAMIRRCIGCLNRSTAEIMSSYNLICVELLSVQEGGE